MEWPIVSFFKERHVAQPKDVTVGTSLDSFLKEMPFGQEKN